MPAHSQLESPLERHLLVQMGERLRRARRDRDVTATALAERLGISRTTLRAVEAGDPSPTMGTYVRVLGALGLAGDLVLVAAADHRQAAMPASPQSGFDADLVSRALHSEVARMVAARPALRVKARAMTARDGVLGSLAPRLARRFRRAVDLGGFQDLLEDSADGRAMRAVSPLPELVPESRRDAAVSRFLSALRVRTELQPRVVSALADLRKHGVRAEVVGSFAWGGFEAGSDVDILVLDSAKLSDGDIYDIVARHLQKAKFDIVYYAQMTPRSREYMRRQRALHGLPALEVEPPS